MEEYYNIKFPKQNTYCNFITISYKKDKNTTHCPGSFYHKIIYKSNFIN